MNEETVEVIAQYFADVDGEDDYTSYLRTAYGLIQALEDSGFTIVGDDEG